MIIATSIKTKVVISLSGLNSFRLERKKQGGEWLVFNAGSFSLFNESTELFSGDLVDNTVGDGLYQYRCCDYSIENPTDKDFEYTSWIRCGETNPIGYTFGNYQSPEGQWGTLITPDDIRYTYLWGTDLRAANGQSYTDEQIQFFIDTAMYDIGRELDITIKKTKIRYNAKERGLIKGVDYDVDESYYQFSWSRISRHGLVKTRQRPILSVESFDMLSRFQPVKNLLSSTIIDKPTGTLKFMQRPIKPTETVRGIEASIGMYGTQTLNAYLFYAIDYDVGFETSDDIPPDLREIIAKQTAVSMLNVIGDGLMSGFSSSSLSMDGMSESFSSTQSATSAYFGARIKEYKDDIDKYLKANKRKFSNLPLGNI